MNKHKFFIPLIFIVMSFTSCQYGLNQMFYRSQGIDERGKYMDRFFVNLGDIYTTSEDSYSFFIFTDCHFGSSKFSGTDGIIGFLEDWSIKNSTDEKKKIRFALFLGDASDTGDQREYEDWKELDKKISQIILPNNPNATNVLCILGNHDVFNDGFPLWKKYCYPYQPTFRFAVSTGIGKRVFYSMDSSNSLFGTGQLDFMRFKMTSDYNLDMRTTVMSHSPLHTYAQPFISMDNQDRIGAIKLFNETGVDFYMSGHIHLGGTYDFKLFREICFKSHTKDHGGSFFYVATMDEKARHMTVSRYDNFGWEAPLDVDVYKF